MRTLSQALAENPDSFGRRSRAQRQQGRGNRRGGEPHRPVAPVQHAQPRPTYQRRPHRTRQPAAVPQQRVVHQQPRPQRLISAKDRKALHRAHQQAGTQPVQSVYPVAQQQAMTVPPGYRLVPVAQPSTVPETHSVEMMAGENWGPVTQLGRGLRIQAGPGRRAAIKQLGNGLYAVAEVPEASLQGAFGSLLAPILIRAIRKAVKNPEGTADAVASTIEMVQDVADAALPEALPEDEPVPSYVPSYVPAYQLAGRLPAPGHFGAWSL